MSSDKDVRHLVEVVLRDLPKPDRESPDITLKVFQAIETNPDTYGALYRLYGGSAINTRIAVVIKEILGGENLETRTVSPEECTLVSSYTRFKLPK